MRNPKWHRDEIILALDLYFDPNRGPIDRKNQRIIELSETINRLPIFEIRPDAEKFRNPNGVTLKLSNFLAFDPEYHGVGMTSGSKLDREVFNEYYVKKAELRRIAESIREVSKNEQLSRKIYDIEEDELSEADQVREGKVLYKLHKVRERNAKIVALKKAQAISTNNGLFCEACVFSFQEYYGDIGRNFIECHHIRPLAEARHDRNTSLDDLALVCSNCHRMLHKGINLFSIQDLKMMIKYDRRIPV